MSPSRSTWLAAVFALAAAGPPRAAYAEPVGPPSAPPQAPTETDPKRPIPDYDGRGAPPTTAGDVALWVPRVALSPLYLVSEYVVRRPLGWFIATAERKQWPSVVRDFFLFGPDKSAGVLPTAFVDFGLRPSLGIFAFWDNVAGSGHDLRFQGTTFGKAWLQGAFADRVKVGENGSVDFRVEGTHRPDQVFHGLGPRSLQEDRSRYGITRFMARPVFEVTWWRGSRITAEAGAKYVRFREDSCCNDPSLDQQVARGVFESPPLYASGGYSSLFQRLEITADSRAPRPYEQSGFRAAAEIEHASNMRRSTGNWVKYGGWAGGFLDLRNNRTLSLSAGASFVTPLSPDAQIPFTELVVLGGQNAMRGYLYGRLIDRSAAVATLKYRWPVWAFLDGAMQLAAGNVFGPNLEDFSPRLLRLSAAIGVESVGAADHTFEFLAGFGTETFADALQVNSFRLLFGTNRGF